MFNSYQSPAITSHHQWTSNHQYCCSMWPWSTAGGVSTKDHPADLGRSKIHRRWGHGWIWGAMGPWLSFHRDGSAIAMADAIWLWEHVGITWNNQLETNEIFYELFYGAGLGFDPQLKIPCLLPQVICGETRFPVHRVWGQADGEMLLRWR